MLTVNSSNVRLKLTQYIVQHGSGPNLTAIEWVIISKENKSQTRDF